MRIGGFQQPVKLNTRIQKICIGKSAFSLTLKVLLAMSLLLILSGNVELNPGPTTGTVTGNKQSRLSISNAGDIRVTRNASNADKAEKAA